MICPICNKKLDYDLSNNTIYYRCLGPYHYIFIQTYKNKLKFASFRQINDNKYLCINFETKTMQIEYNSNYQGNCEIINLPFFDPQGDWQALFARTNKLLAFY
jgi:hypothetical protein